MNFNGVFSAQTFRQDVEIVHFMWPVGTASKNNALASLTIRFSCCTLSQPFPLCFKQLQRRAAIPCDTGATMEAQGAFAASG